MTHVFEIAVLSRVRVSGGASIFSLSPLYVRPPTFPPFFLPFLFHKTQITATLGVVYTNLNPYPTPGGDWRIMAKDIMDTLMVCNI
eukprot:1391743-Amorphochlora_amoeboformis.AAC.2